MRYISKIEAVPEGLTSKLLHVSFGMDDERFSVTMHDTETGLEEQVRPSSLPYRECLGYCQNISHLGGVVVEHSDKTALLHKYVKVAETKKGAPSILMLSVDSCSIHDTNVKENGRIQGRQDIAINTYNTMFEVSGLLGSVAVKRDGGGSAEILTLYDVLGYVCRKIGYNIMMYRTIYLYSSLLSYKTTIELEHSKESDRFFMKMYLDTVRA